MKLSASGLPRWLCSAGMKTFPTFQESLPGGCYRQLSVYRGTGHYCSGGGHSDRKFAYLCVYHPTQWIPVAWGRRQGDSVRFQNVCPNIVYHPALYADGKLQLTGHPFLLDTLGYVNVLAPQADTVNCVLSTLYKDAPKLIKLLPSFVGARYKEPTVPISAMRLHTIPLRNSLLLSIPRWIAGIQSLASTCVTCRPIVAQAIWRTWNFMPKVRMFP